MLPVPSRRRGSSSSGLLLILAGCDGPQSALQPAGQEAESLASLFWIMAGGAVLIWATVLGIAVYAVRFGRYEHARSTATALILGGGVCFPVLVLTVLLMHGLLLMRELRAPADPGSVRVLVEGELWWWRIAYRLPDGSTIDSANEVRLPAGRRTEFELTSAGVIHSFWIPSLAGKMDLIPGRTNRLVLEPLRPGEFRGQCAEFCGTPHALMAFSAVVMEPDAFEAWLRQAAGPAKPPDDEVTIRGQEVFLTSGCGACHAIRGTEAEGRLGPDLTHVGSRHSLGAGALPRTAEAFARWIAHTGRIKPEVRMPDSGMLPDRDLRALAAYLDSLT